MPRSRKSRYAPEYRVLLTMLCDYRVAAQITQIELAAKMGTSQSMLSKLERGVVRMDVIDLLDYLAGTGVDPIEFMKSFLLRTGWKKAHQDRARVRLPRQ